MKRHGGRDLMSGTINSRASALCILLAPWRGLKLTNLKYQVPCLLPLVCPCYCSIRRAGYPFGTLVDFASDGAGLPIFCLSPLAIHARNLIEDPRCSLVVQMPGWTGLANARVTIFGDVYQLPPDMQVSVNSMQLLLGWYSAFQTRPQVAYISTCRLPVPSLRSHLHMLQRD